MLKQLKYYFRIKLGLVVFSFILLFSINNISAQTFEKIYPIPFSGNYLSDIHIDESLNTYLVIRQSSPRSDSLLFSSRPIYLKLDFEGNEIQRSIIQPKNLDATFIDSINHVGIDKIRNDGTRLIHYGSIRTSNPLGFSLLRMETDYDFNLIDHDLIYEIQDTFPAFSKFKEVDSHLYLSGSRISLSNGGLFGNLIKINEDSIQLNKRLFSDQEGIHLDDIYDVLIDDKGNTYTFSNGYDPPPFYLNRGLQINKLDPNFKFLKKELIKIPPRHSSEEGELYFARPNAFWLSDSTFLLVTAKDNNIDTAKGDVHFFIYDTTLNRLDYKRLITTDTNLLSLNNNLVYDSSSGHFYFGVTQTLRELRFGNVFYYETPSAFRLLKFDSDLNIIWDKTYYNEASIRLEQMAIDKNGIVSLAGTYEDSTSRSEGNNRYIYLLRVDSAGNYLRTGNKESHITNTNDFRLYPNPFTNYLYSKKLDELSSNHIQIFDSYGRLLFNEEISSSELMIKTEDWSSGIYFYQLKNQFGYSVSGKLIKP